MQYKGEQDSKELMAQTCETRKLMVEYEKLSRIDPLTELLNRRAMLEYLRDETVRANRTDELFCIVLCDIDFFKRVNDNYGHACGDVVLKKLAEIFKNTVRENDRIARWGGEEFCLLLPGTYLEGAKTLAERLRMVVTETTFPDVGADVSVTMTFGVAQHKPHQDIDVTLAEADRALYSGKVNGRNRVVVYTA